MATNLSIILSLLLLLAGVDGAYAATDAPARDGIALEAQDNSFPKAPVDDHDGAAYSTAEPDSTATHRQTSSLPVLELVPSQTTHHALIRAPPSSSFSPISIL